MKGVTSRLATFLPGLIALALVAAILASASPASAQDSAARPSILIVEPLEPQPLGKRINVNVKLINQQGRRLPNKPLRVYVDGELVRQARTDDRGEANIRISQDLPVGSYALRVMFIGTEAYQWSMDRTEFIVRPVQLEVKVVPPLTGIEFVLGGPQGARTFTSGDDGLARIELDELGIYPLEVLTPDDLYAPGTRVEFERWRRAFFEPAREVDVRGDTKLEVGFALYHPISLTFAELDGREVPESRISNLTLKSSHGELHTLEDGGPHWLQANRIARRVTGLDVTPVQYGVQSVMIDGASVVNQYQQRFFVEAFDVWPVELLLYSARFRGVDALFGFPVGDGIALRFPDDRVESLPFGSDDESFADSLARGDYTVQVTGVKGMAPETPVALSKNQDVTLKVLTAFDMILAATLGTVVALGLLLYGRPSLLHLPKDAVSYIFSLPKRIRRQTGRLRRRKDEPISI